MGLTFAVLSYWCFGALTAMPGILFDRPVFYMQRDSKYYRTTPYLISCFVADVSPFRLLLFQVLWLRLLFTDTANACGIEHVHMHRVLGD